ncbi:RidA family protein [Nonomuraea sp. NPDC005983]|uniref:RidA family protein n=1 Tax=Nonomuraea sp. NPDC005983 TaxID=3155595 RepID=UPI0033BF87F4
MTDTRHTKSASTAKSGEARAKLAELGLELLDHPAAGSYKPLVIDGDLAFVSGHVGWRNGGASAVGMLGDDFTVENGQFAARDAALALLGTLEKELGTLDRIAGVPRLFGMVRALPTFTQHPAVINGASQLLLDVLGERGEHSRSAVGMTSLPFGAAVEIEAVVRLAW